MGKMTPPGAAREKFHFQFITTPTSDTAGTTLLLHFDNKRYLFGNISEGTQRACIQRGIGLKKVRHIFLSGSVRWRNTGGLIGLILTMADAQAAERESEKPRPASMAPSTNIPRKPESSTEPSRSLGEESLMIHGGEKLMHTLACARGFVFRKGMPVSINEFEHMDETEFVEPAWKDENIQVWAMSIVPSLPGTADSDYLGSSDAIASSPEVSPGISKKKRTHDDFKRGNDESMTRSSLDQHLRHQELRQSIITHMFNSTWNRDALFETPLADVKMPAALFVRDPETKKIEYYRGPKPGDEGPLPDIKVLVRNPWPGALIEGLPPVRDTGVRQVISYIVQGYPQRGRFDPQKALALGVPRGPSYSSLAAGNSVALENGTVVTPDMVLGPTKPGRGIAIVELPSSLYVSNLIGRPEWKSEHLRNGIVAICWILGRGVESHPELKTFMESMPNVEHIISSKAFCPNYLAFDSSAASAIRLSRISRSCFPVPVHDNVALPQLGTISGRKAPALPNFTAANRGLMIQVEPKFLIQKCEIPPLLNTAEVVRNLPEKVWQYARLARAKISTDVARTHDSNPASHHELSDFDPEIITLGTGSALPSKYRNVSATLLLTGRYGNFLFDCGENTLGQLRRIFDPPALRDVLRNLKFIWISHLHADHHLGTVSVLAEKRRASIENASRSRAGEPLDKAPEHQNPVVVASEEKMLRFLEEYESVETVASIQPLSCQPYQAPVFGRDMASFKLGIRSLHTCQVDHCSGAQAISISFTNGFKFSYSGDCRPSVPFVNIGKGSDVLVHEATFDDDMEGDALAKKHSTTGEALGVASKMEAKNVILTHFSQRYQKLPVMENMKLPSSTEESPKSSPQASPAVLGELGEPGAVTGGASTASDSKVAVEQGNLVEVAGLDAPNSRVSKLDMNICVAFDYMRVRVSDIKHMQEFTPALAALFEAERSKPVGEVATPQEKSDVINRAGRQKRSQDIRSNNRSEPSPTFRRVSSSPSEVLNVPRISVPHSEPTMEITAPVNEPRIDLLQSPDNQPNTPP